jgi:hypothetical protein
MCRLQGTASGAHPQAVVAFLQQVAQALQPAAQQQVQELLDLARELQLPLSGPAGGEVAPCDLGHLQMVQQLPLADDPELSALARQLELQAGLRGLGRLTEQLLGLSLAPEELARCEAWAPGVSKLVLREARSGAEAGHVYLQVCEGLGVARTSMVRRAAGLRALRGAAGAVGDCSAPPPCRCATGALSAAAGCVLGAPPCPGAQAASLTGPAPPPCTRCRHAEVERDGTTCPAAVLVRLPRAILPGAEPQPGPAAARLLWLATLLHEAGHALHYLLSSRPGDLQASAAACPLELCELPSHLLERFLDDPRCLQLMLGAGEGGAPWRGAEGAGGGWGGVAAPPRVWAKLAALFRRQRHAVDMQQHVVLAIMDQLLASGLLGPADDVSDALQQLLRQYLPSLFAAELQEGEGSSGLGCMTLGLAKYIPGLALHGGQMYGYIFAQLVAAAAWRRHLAADPLDPVAGDQLRGLLLGVGNGRGSAEVVRRLLGEGSLVEVHPGCCVLDLESEAFEDLQLFGW